MVDWLVCWCVCVIFDIIYVIICRQVVENNCVLFQQATKIDRSTLLMRGVNTQQAFQAHSIVVSGHTHVQHGIVLLRAYHFITGHTLGVHTVCIANCVRMCVYVCVLVSLGKQCAHS